MNVHLLAAYRSALAQADVARFTGNETLRCNMLAIADSIYKGARDAGYDVAELDAVTSYWQSSFYPVGIPVSLTDKGTVAAYQRGL